MAEQVGIVTPAELKATMSSGKPVFLLDVREPVERSFCAIPAIAKSRDLFVPMGQITARVEEIRAASAGLPVVVYCHHGVRSMAVARWLAAQAMGDVLNLDGGIDAWSLEADPTTPRY